MDPATHALTSFALARGFFPRRSWPFTIGVVLAGTLADVDLLTLLFGPRAYLDGHHTVTHSLICTVVIIAISAAFVDQCRARFLKRGAIVSNTAAESFAIIVLAASGAVALHLLMDLTCSQGIALLWPFGTVRFAWDCVRSLDPWILTLLLAGLLLPEIFRLVGSEIGAREKSPRGRNGALVALTLIVIYVGARAVLHNNAEGQLDAHTYRGESPRRVAVFPDSSSAINWRGVVETTTQICTIDLGATESFDPEGALCVHKPEESQILAAAQKTETAQKFLQATRLPKARVDTTEEGSEIVLRDMRDIAQNDSTHALAARILLDRSGQVTNQKILWARTVHLR